MLSNDIPVRNAFCPSMTPLPGSTYLLHEAVDSGIREYLVLTERWVTWCLGQEAIASSVSWN